MSRKTKAKGHQSVMELLMDPIFGFMGALIVLFLMQVISMVNTIDKDLISAIEDSSKKVQRLEAKEREGEAIKSLLESLEDQLKDQREKFQRALREKEESQQKAAEQAALAAQYQKYEQVLKDQTGSSEAFISRITALEKEISQLRASANDKTVQQPLIIKTLKLPDAIQDKSYSLTVAIEGGVPPFVFNRSGLLPEGIQLKEDYGEIFGKPAKKGTYDFSIHVKDAKGSETNKKFSLNVNSAGGFEGERSWKEKVSTWIIIIALFFILLFFILIGLSIKEERRRKKQGRKLIEVDEDLLTS